MHVIVQLLIMSISLSLGIDERPDKDYTYKLTVETQVAAQQNFELTLLSTELEDNAEEVETKIVGTTPWTLNLKSGTHKIHVLNQIEEVDIIKVRISAIADGGERAIAESISYVAVLKAGPGGTVQSGGW